ncbi:MAG: response regulator transcription factor [Clostridia bacterium]|nr:response regulator transcription factor [Clostridia bacterium]
MRIIIAEDERDLNRILTRKLTDEGYSVDSCFDGEQALDYLESADYDGAILDVMMPKMDGFTVLSEIRKKGISTPVLFLTARDSVRDRVHGLDSGASDYLVKPFSMEELLARVRALTRRSYETQSSILRAGDLELDLSAHTVSRAGRAITLSAKEFSLLSYLMHNKNRVLSREKIENHIWNFDYEGGTNVVDVYIRYLRKKIDDDFDEKLIHTVRGAGYILKCAGEEKE